MTLELQQARIIRFPKLEPAATATAEKARYLGTLGTTTLKHDSDGYEVLSRGAWCIDKSYENAAGLVGMSIMIPKTVVPKATVV